MPELRRLRLFFKRVIWPYTTAIIVVALLSAGCGDNIPDRSLSTPVQEVIQAPTQSAAPFPTADSTEADNAANFSPTQEEMVSLPELPVSPTAAPTSTPSDPEKYPPCSPLSLHPLEELREIVSDPYHPPPPGREERHQGVDFSYYRRGDRTTIQGVGVQAVFPGRVAASIQGKFPYGNMVIIETSPELLSPEFKELLQIPEGESLYTLYAHMDKPPLVVLDESVEACQALGEVGKSGNAAEPHLHLEMRLGPASHDFLSMAYYGAKDTEEERAAYVLWRTSWQFRHFDPMSVLGTSR